MRFWDASALVPLLVAQSASARMRRAYRVDPEVVVWWGTKVQCDSAVARLEKALDRARRRVGETPLNDDAQRQVERIVQLMLIGGLGQALITYLSLHALEYISVGPLAFLFYTYPAWVALLAAIRRTDRLTLARIVALVLALAGVTIMVGAPPGKLNPIGVILALASALLYSAYLPALGQVQKGVPALLATFLLITGAAISFVIAALFVSELFIPHSISVWVNILLLAFVSTVIAFSSLIKGLSVLGSVRTAIIATVEPFFTAILGVLVLGNQFSTATLIGGVFIAAAVFLIEWSSTQLTVTA